MDSAILFQFLNYWLHRDKDDRVQLVLMWPWMSIESVARKMRRREIGACFQQFKTREQENDELKAHFQKCRIPFWYLQYDYSGFYSISQIEGKESYAQIDHWREDEPYVYHNGREEEKSLQCLPWRWRIIAGIRKEK